MAFWKRKDDKPAIPPVQDDRSSNSSSPRPSYRSNATTYVASRDGDPYSGSTYAPSTRSDSTGDSGYTSMRDKYNRNNGVGDVYSRGQADLNSDRNELFSGYNPEKGSGRFFDGPPEPRDVPPGEETEEDVEAIKSRTKYVKQESLASTRNALRLAREAEETARNTLGRLGDQSEKLANTERHLDVSKGYSQRADDKTDELKQLNRSIFRPVITFNKDAKRAAQAAKVESRYEEERSERERGAMDVRETQNRLGRAQTYGREDGDDGYGGRRYRTEEQLAARKQDRKRYQFEATQSDDEVEDELDDNLDEISDATKRLKALAMAMGQETDAQIERIKKIEDKTTSLDNRIFRNTERLKKIK